jgi:hypothetical protein
VSRNCFISLLSSCFRCGFPSFLPPSFLSLDFFKSAASQTIHTLHKPLLDMMFKSPELCRSLGQSSVFTNALVKRLKNTEEAIVLRSLLKMLQLMYEFHATPKEWVESNQFVKLVQEYALSERKVLVRQLAKKLLLDFQEPIQKTPVLEAVEKESV